MLALEAIAQDKLKLKGNKSVFTGQMVRIDSSSFKFWLMDGGIMQEATSLIDSVYLSNPEKRAEALKISILQNRILPIHKQIEYLAAPIMMIKPYDNALDRRIDFGIKEADKHIRKSRNLFVISLACGIAAFLSAKDYDVNPVLAIGSLVFFTASGIELIQAGNALRHVESL